MDIGKFKRENVDRNFSERMIDRFMHKSQRDESLKRLTENYDILLKKTKIQEQEKLSEEQKPKVMNVEVYSAFEKLRKPLASKEKAPKALELIKKLIEENSASLHSLHILDAVLEITYQLSKNLNTKESRINVLALFSFIAKRKETLLIAESEKALFDILSVGGLIHNSLYTDDSYQFNSNMKHLEIVFKELNEDYSNNIEEFSTEFKEIPVTSTGVVLAEKVISNIENNVIDGPEKEKLTAQVPSVDEEKKTVSEVIPIYEYKPSSRLEMLLAEESRRERFELKKSLFIGITKDLLIFYKNQWAKPALNIFFNSLLHNQAIFNKFEQEDVMKLISNLRSAKAADTAKNAKRSNLDEMILLNPLNSKNEVVDARAVVFSSDGLNNWSAKQSGL